MPERRVAARRLLPTLMVGALGGALAFFLGVPLPWLLGAMLATTVCTLAGLRLASPGASRQAVLAAIGVMLGSAFTPGLSGDITSWLVSLGFMLIVTAAMMALSVWFGRRVAGYSMNTALYAGVPGGVSAITLMAAESDADLRIVGLTHAVRIVVLLMAIPPVLSLLGHVHLRTPSGDPNQWLTLPAPLDVLWLLGAGLIGAWLGRRLALPVPLLFGPMLASAALHLTGLTDAVLPPLVVALAQVFIGISVGTRFGGTAWHTLGRALLMATLQAGILLAMAIAAAGAVQLFTGYSIAAALLAYMPGGAPELSLVALALGIEPAFVTSHHLLRMTVLILTLPVLLKRLTRSA